MLMLSSAPWVVALSMGLCVPLRCAPSDGRSARRVTLPSMSDASRRRDELLRSLDDKLRSEQATPPDEDAPSHLTLERDALTGEPLLARATYVDEEACIGCKNCALVARNTFLMEQRLGKARVYQQAGDSEELIAEAIDSCPVNCIHYVSAEDLETLERERAARAGKVTINNYGSFKRAWVGGGVARPETSAKYYNNAKMGTRCNNCPSKGCKKCPMYGVGENPAYIARLERLNARREASGEAQAEAEQRERAALVDTLMGADFAVVDGQEQLLGVAADAEAALDVLGAEYGLEGGGEAGSLGSDDEVEVVGIDVGGAPSAEAALGALWSERAPDE